MLRSLHSKARPGVVSWENVAEMLAKRFVTTDHPVCAASEAVFFLMAQLLLLFQEGNYTRLRAFAYPLKSLNSHLCWRLRIEGW
jgi:hypothetical protein